MKNIKMSDSEIKLMNLVWDNAPINSTQLVKEAATHLGWKKSTTYTVIRRLSERGILKNENAMVTFIIKREEVQQVKGEEILGKVYEGSIKMFLSAFLSKQKISVQEAEELKQMIDEYIDKED